MDICDMNIHHLHTHGHEHGFVRSFVGHCRITMVLIGGNFCRKIERDSLQYVRRVSFFLVPSFPLGTMERWSVVVVGGLYVAQRDATTAYPLPLADIATRPTTAIMVCLSCVTAFNGAE